MIDKREIYPEWNKLKRNFDEENPFSNLYELDDGSLFYVEPAFYTQLSNLFNLKPYVKDRVLKAMESLTKQEKKVIFTLDYEHPLTHKKDFVYREIEDVLDPLLIFVEDKSRGSDYGD